MDDRPPGDAYERVTNPERYQPVVDAARALVERLVAEYDAVLDVSRDDHDHEVLRVTPAAPGGAITITLSDFPGVGVELGHGFDALFPSCGCDACDERPDQLVEDLELLVDAFVSGRFVEEFDGRWATASSWGPGWSRRSGSSVERWDPDARARGVTAWPAWSGRAT